MAILMRKLAIMTIGIFNSTHVQRGWFLGSFAVVSAIAAHAYARPYLHNDMDMLEFSSLLVTLLVFQVSDLPCNVRREGGQSLVIGGPSLVILEGKACNPL